MYELVITCLKCGADRSVHGLAEKAKLSDDEVIAQAGHTPQCSLKLSGSGKVQSIPREHEPWVSIYTVTELLERTDDRYDEPQATYPDLTEEA